MGILLRAWMPGALNLSLGTEGEVLEGVKEEGTVTGRGLHLKGEDPEIDLVTVKETKRVVTNLLLVSEKDPQICPRKSVVIEKVCQDLISPDQDLLRDRRGLGRLIGRESLHCMIRLCLRR